MMGLELATPRLQTECRLAVELNSPKAIAGNELNPIIGILAVNFFTGTRSSCVQQNYCTSRMRSQPQLRNDKYIMIQYANWINKTPSQQ